MAENNNDTPKRKYKIWLDNGELKIIDIGYDWHTNVKNQASVRLEVADDGREIN